MIDLVSHITQAIWHDGAGTRLTYDDAEGLAQLVLRVIENSGHTTVITDDLRQYMGLTEGVIDLYELSRDGPMAKIQARLTEAASVADRQLTLKAALDRETGRAVGPDTDKLALIQEEQRIELDQVIKNIATLADIMDGLTIGDDHHVTFTMDELDSLRRMRGRANRR